MLAIDGLIHGFHYILTSGPTRRLVGINLIRGHLDFVVVSWITYLITQQHTRYPIEPGRKARKDELVTALEAKKKVNAN